MKNKHLVLLFFGVILLGVANRFCQFNLGNALSAKLFNIPFSEVQHIDITGTEALRCSRASVTGWLISKGDGVITAPDSLMEHIERIFTGLTTVRLLHSDQPDTLGLGAKERISVVFTTSASQSQQYYIGRSSLVQGDWYTWVALPKHEQYYLVKGQLPNVFRINWEQLQPSVPVLFDTAQLAAVSFFWGTDTLFDLKRAASGLRWESKQGNVLSPLPEQAVLAWKQHWEAVISTAKLADFFDKRSASETFCGEIMFNYQKALEKNVKYRLFFIRQPVLPDDPEKRRYFRNFKPQYILESDLQLGLYFSIADTSAIHQLKHL